MWELRCRDQFCIEVANSRIWDPLVAICWPLSPPCCEVQTPAKILLIRLCVERVKELYNEKTHLNNNMEPGNITLHLYICKIQGMCRIKDVTRIGCP